jgi:hypothetical protein
MVFFMPESKYLGKRPALIQTRSQEDFSGKVADHEDEVNQEDPHTDIPAKSFVSKMAVFPQVERQLNWFKLFCRPFVLLTYPTVLWVISLLSILLIVRVASFTEWRLRGVSSSALRSVKCLEKRIIFQLLQY